MKFKDLQPGNAFSFAGDTKKFVLLEKTETHMVYAAERELYQTTPNTVGITMDSTVFLEHDVVLINAKGNTLKDFSEAAAPLIEYLKNNHHPHVTAIVTGISAELLEGQCLFRPK